MLLSQKRIFIIEDDSNNRFIMQALLEEHGAVVNFQPWKFYATTFRLTQFMPIDLVILDLMLPNNTSGYQIFATIRQNPAFDSIPIVAVSAADPDIAMNAAREQGFVGFIGKPIDSKIFAHQMADVIGGKKIWHVI